MVAKCRVLVTFLCWAVCDVLASALLLSTGHIANFVLFVIRAIFLIAGVQLSLTLGQGKTCCYCLFSSRAAKGKAAVPLLGSDGLDADVPEDDLSEQRARENQMAKHKWKINAAVYICFAIACIEAVYTGIQISSLPDRFGIVSVALCATIACIAFEYLNFKSLSKSLVSDEGVKLAVHEHPLHYTPNVSLAVCSICHERIGPRTGGYEAFECRTCEGGGKGGGKGAGGFKVCLMCYRKQSIKDNVQEGILRGDKGPKHTPDLSASDYLKRTLLLTAPFKCSFMTAIFCILIAECSSSLLPNQQGQIINSLVAGDESKFAGILKRYVVLSVTAAFFSSIRGLTVQLVAKQIQLALRSDMFKSILKQDMAFFDGIMSGQLTSRMTNDVGSVTTPVTNVMTVFLSNGIKFVAGSFMCFYTSWKLTVLALTMIGPVVYITGVYANWSKDLNMSVRAKLGDANACATETLRNVRTVRSFGAVSMEQKVFDGFLGEAWSNMKKDAWAAAGIGAIGGYVQFAAGVLIYWYGGKAVLGGSDSSLNIGNLITFNMYWTMLKASIQNMNGLLNTLVVAASAAKRVYEIVDMKPDIPIDDADATPLEKLVPIGQACSIELRNVHFTYQTRPETPILQGLSFTIPAGSTAAFVGKSGCGKSTAFQLLLRFYDPLEGEILVQGVPLTSINLCSYQRRLAVVSQETQMFARSIKDNLTYGMKPEDFTDEDIIKAAKQANAHDFIAEMDRGYNSILGESGGGLSGGQKQRLSIARAFLRKPQLLFLDEATSALDSANEKQIQAALDDMIQQMGTAVSVVIIAHRLSTIMGCDKIIVINQGVVLEQGSHSQLMENDNIYAALVKTQMAHQDSPEDGDVEDATDDEEATGKGKDKGKGKGKGKGNASKGKGSGNQGKEGKGDKRGEDAREGKESKGTKEGKQGKNGKGGKEGKNFGQKGAGKGMITWKNVNELNPTERRAWLRKRIQIILSRALTGFGSEEVSEVLLSCIQQAIDEERMDSDAVQGESKEKAPDSIAMLFQDIMKKLPSD